MDENLIVCCFIVFVGLWRHIGINFCPCLLLLKARERCPTIHQFWLNWFGWTFRWYMVYIYGMGWMLVRSVGDIFKWDVIYFHWLDMAHVKKSLPDIFKCTDFECGDGWQLKPDAAVISGLDVAACCIPLANNTTGGEAPPAKNDELELYAWLKYVSFGGSFAGIAAFVVVCATVISSTIKYSRDQIKLDSAEIASGNKRPYNPWIHHLKDDLVVVIIFTPSVFALMALRAQIRMWSIMTGSSWELHSTEKNWNWNTIKIWELEAGRMSLEVASFFQYFAVIAFLELVSYCFEIPAQSFDTNETHSTASNEESKAAPLLGKAVQIRTWKKKVKKTIGCCCFEVEEEYDVEAFPIDKAVKINLFSNLPLDVTPKVNDLIQENGIADLTCGQPLEKAIPGDVGEGHIVLRIQRGKHSLDFASKWCFCIPRRNFNLQYLDTSKDYAWTLKWAGMLGVWCYILLGMLRSIVTIVAVGLSAFNPQFWNDMLHNYNMLMDTFNIVFGYATIVCIINMSLILQIKDTTAKDALGRTANLKFLATRGLLLISQFLPQVLQKWTLDNGAKETFFHKQRKLTSKLPKFLSEWHLSVYQSCLLNASLLCYFCLIFAVVNHFFWRRAFKAQHEKEEAKPSEEEDEKPSSEYAKMVS